MPCITYVERRFSADSLAIIEHANELITDYASQGLALTLRQLYYRFVAADLLPNSQKSYSRLGSIVNDARLAGLMDWDAIEDRGRNLIKNSHWDSPSDIIETCVHSFAFDKWEGQEYRVEVWVEKQALEAVIGQAAEPLDCPYFACKGYTSQSEMWRAAQRFEGYVENDQKPVIIHLGDHDPSGIDMTRDIEERLNQVFGVEVEVERIALNMSQIEKYKPPPNPAKMTDSRFEKYVEEHGTKSWELDALDPRTLRTLIQHTIKQYLDVDLFNEKVEAENQARAGLAAVASRWPEVEKFVNQPKKKEKR